MRRVSLSLLSLSLLLFFLVTISSSTSPSSSSSSSSTSSSSPLSSTPSRFPTKQKTFTKALRSLVTSSLSSPSAEQEEEEEEEEGWEEWSVSSTNELISMFIMIMRAPIVNLLPGGSSTDIFRELPNNWPKNEDYDLDSVPSEEEELDVYGQLNNNYASMFKSMNIPATLDALFGEVVVGHVSNNDPQTLQRFKRSQNIIQKQGLFSSQPSALTGSSSLPSSSSSSSSSSSNSRSSFKQKAESFKERIGKVIEEKEREKERERKREEGDDEEELVCSGVGVEVWVEDTDDVNETDSTDSTDRMHQECICPVDYDGERCEKFRAFTCFFDLVEPEADCQPTDFGIKYEGSPVCFLYSLRDSITLTYQMKCQFVNKTIHSEDDPFDYKVYNFVEEKEKEDTDSEGFDETDTDSNATETKTVEFAISADRQDVFNAFLKVYNFNRFGDLDASQQQIMSLDQIRGNETVSLPLDFSRLDQNRYIFGGRLYTEMGLQSIANGAVTQVGGLYKNFRNRIHFDFTDSKVREPTVDYSEAGWKRFLLLYIAMAVCLVLFVVYWCSRCVNYFKRVDKED